MYDDVVEGFELSLQQRRLWLANTDARARRAWCTLDFEGALDARALHDALFAVVDRHEILRTLFVRQPGLTTPLQAVGDPSLSWQEVDLRGTSSADCAARIAVIERAESRAAVDLERGPALRATLVARAEGSHALVLSLPLLCADGPTLSLLAAEVGRAYGGDSGDGDEVLQYLQFSEWQSELVGEDDAGRDYWRGRRLARRGRTGFPFARPETSDTRREIERAPLDLTAAHTATIDRLATDAGATAADAALACWAALAHRLTAVEEVAIARAADGRRLAELHGALGAFARWLPTDFAFRPGLRLSDVVRRAGAVAREDDAWVDTFDESLGGAAGGDDPAPPCPIAFEYFDDDPVVDASGVRLGLVRRAADSERFDVKLSVERRGATTVASIRYDASRVDAEDVERLGRSFLALVESASSDADVDALDVHAAVDRERLRAEHGDGATPADGALLHELFEAQAAATPSQPALVFGAARLTYAELDERASRLAGVLRRAGVGPDEIVAICADRSELVVVAMLATLKAGGAFAVLDVGQPAERLRLMLDACRPRAILADARLSPTSSDAAVLRLDEATPAIEAADGETEPASALAGNVAYVVFTSGSTGSPKAVAVEHRQIVNYVRAVVDRLELPRDAVFATVSTFAADLGHTSLFPALATGGCVHVVPEDVAADADAMAAYLRDERVDCLKIVPSHLAALRPSGSATPVAPARRLVLGGEALRWDLVEALEAGGVSCEIFNHYGPTETTVGVLAGRVRADARDPRSATVPLGRPLDGASAYVLDRALVPAPVWMPGELFVGGACVARGYLGRPEPTAERFVPDPFSSHAGARMYRTGDSVRRLPDGRIEFLGRVDHQVKIRGFRVEPGEVEAAVRHHPDVADAIVVAASDDAGETRLAAYVVARRGARVPADLREFLAARVPDYMVPSSVVALDALPLTANGKVDRRALPDPAAARSERRAEYVAPRGSVEEVIAEIWAEILRVERVGRDDDFFELGGHSLMATRVVSRLRECLKVELELRSVFAMSTVARLAESVQSALRTSTAAEPAIVRRAGESDAPLSFSQQRFWFLDRLEDGGPFYNSRHPIRLTGQLDVAALERTLSEIVRRHEVLRTIFPVVDAAPVQRVAPAAPLAVRHVDLSALADEEREAAVARLVGDDALVAFDLAAGPLLRVTLARLGEREHVAIFTTHHIVSDGWSMGILMREFAAIYPAFAAGLPSPLPELSLQYSDFAVWQRDWLRDGVLDAEVAHWRARLAGAPPVLDLPADRTRPATQSVRSRHHRLVVAPEVADALGALGRREGVTLFMTMLAAFDALLFRYTGQSDVVVGTPIAGRTHAELEPLIGFFLNTLVMRTSLDGDPTVRELLARVREVALDAYAHQSLPFEKLVEELQPKRDLSRTPIFQVLFVFQNLPHTALEADGLAMRSEPLDARWSTFDLTLWVADEPDELVAVFEYNADLFDDATIARMAGHFERLLAAMVAAPDAAVSALPLAGPDEMRLLLDEWNATAAEVPSDRSYQALFAEAVARTPDAVAAVFEASRWTYRELDERTNRLARTLAAEGVEPGAVVALLAERGLDLLAAIVAIFKAGCAYVPLDPRHPPARHAQVLGQSGAPVVLVSRSVADVASMPIDELDAGAGTRILSLDDLLARDASAEPTASTVAPGDLAYVIFTSGSTGTPKGAMVEHRGMVNHLFAKIRDLDLGATDVAAQTASQCFDISVWQFLAALLVGGTVRIYPDEVAHDARALLARVTSDGVTILESVPSLMRAALDGPPGRDEANGAGALRWMIPTGEALPPELCRQWLARYPGVPLVNAYGPTECSDDVTHHKIFAAPPDGVASVPIGRPIANMRMYVLDGRLEPAPVGVPGELYVGGVGVGRGYVNDARRTAEAFLPDRFGGEAGARMYRTGDLVRYLTSGDLEFLGRVDHQVKIRGFRIELGEIETALETHEAVRHAVVLAREAADGDKRLVAYLATSGDAAPSASDLRAYVRARLPEYMAPSAFVTLDAIPLTPNGKIDRAALAAVEADVAPVERTFVAPRDADEAKIAEIWAAVLRSGPVSVEDDFFELGGHSLLATQVVTRMLEAFGVELPIRMVFERPTVRGLAGALGEARARLEEREHADVLAMLDDLSDEEVEAELARRMSS